METNFIFGAKNKQVISSMMAVLVDLVECSANKRHRCITRTVNSLMPAHTRFLLASRAHETFPEDAISGIIPKIYTERH